MKIRKLSIIANLLILLILGFSSFPACLGEKEEVQKMDMLEEGHISYDVKQNFTLIGKDYTVSSDGFFAGTVKKEVFSWGSKYNFINSDGSPLGYFKEQINLKGLSGLGIQANFYDQNVKLIGSINERNIFEKSLFDAGRTFEIKDADGKIQLLLDQKLTVSLFAEAYSWELLSPDKKEKSGTMEALTSSFGYERIRIITQSKLDRRLLIGVVVMNMELIARDKAAAASLTLDDDEGSDGGGGYDSEGSEGGNGSEGSGGGWHY